MPLFEVWSEGYMATGEQGIATFRGKAEAETFNEACIKVVGDKLDKDSQGDYIYGLGNKYSIWGCRLFDNETDARKSFG